MCGACLRLTVLAVPPVIAMIQRDLNLSGTEVGLLSGIPVVVFAIFAAPGSIVVAKAGVRGALLTGLAIAVVGAVLRTGSSNAWQLYLASVIMSVGIAIMQPSMAAAVREWLPGRSAFGTVVYTNGLIMGEIIPVATMLSLILPLFAGSWRIGLGIWAAPLLATAVAVAIFTPKSSMVVVPKHSRWLPQWNSTLNWRIGLTLGSITSTYFCLNGFLPACLTAGGHPEFIGEALTALNAGQIPASFLLLLAADRLQGKRWPFLTLGVLFCVCVVGIMIAAGGASTVFWAGLAGFSCGAALSLGLALAPLHCSDPTEVAQTSAAGFAIGYGFAMIVSFISGAAWDLAGNASAALVPILLGCLPILFATPTYAPSKTARASYLR